MSIELIEELNSELGEARKEYYAGRPVLSDPEYDIKEKELEGLTRGNLNTLPQLPSTLTTVGTDAPGRIPHTYPMRSMPNVYSEEELLEFCKKFPYATFSLSSKWDGISISLRYENGSLKQALTRGDGDAGEDVSAQVATCSSIPFHLAPPFSEGTVIVQGELMVKQSTMEALNVDILAAGGKPFTNPRNMAAGAVKLLDMKEVMKRELVFMPWAVLGDFPLSMDSMRSRLEKLQVNGFLAFDEVLAHTDGDLIAQLRLRLEGLKQPQELGKDGVVIKLDSCLARERAGVGSKNSNWAVAYKPQNMEAVTELIDVEWDVSRGGRIVPVGVLRPVVLGGANIERVTLNNISWLRAMGVTKPCMVSIVRSGDVIPKIVGVEVPQSSRGVDPLPIEAPNTCSSCWEPITEFVEPKSKIATHWCTNVQCPGRVRDMLVYIADRTVLEIDSLGPEMASKLTNLKYVTSLPDLFEWHADMEKGMEECDDFQVEISLQRNGLSYIEVRKMLSSIERCKTTTWDRWLAALCIPMFGRRMGKLLANSLKLMPEDFKDLPAILGKVGDMQLEGIGELKLAELNRNISDPIFIDMTRRLYKAGVRPTSTFSATSAGDGLAGTVFVITGDLLHIGDRDYISKKLEELGAVSKSGVSKKVNLLIVGNNPGNTKLSKAKELNIKQVGEEWVNEIFTKYNVERQGGDAGAEFVD